MILAEVLTHNHGHYPSTIQQLLDEHSSKLAAPAPAPPQLSPPPLAAHPAPALGLHSPLFPGPKVSLIHSRRTDYKAAAQVSLSPLSHYTQNTVSPFTNAAAAAASQRFSPYHYTRFAKSIVTLRPDYFLPM